ncbi:colicin immunity domain-containing protein [Shewanella waksmanii]|uniref:colicin immunity domain-containing protein n=1 Tax=Shewanella waksmanii TaxID=213783 RepID=UPI000490ED90|nr:colicin immunity domain-containing protein [Shewanella waksmanii]
MSKTLLALAKSFSKERLTADEFVNAYIELWKFEGSSGIILKDEDQLSECLSTIFCLADAYSPKDRAAYELDENQLKDKVTEEIINLSNKNTQQL